jgi:hypothetical protein
MILVSNSVDFFWKFIETYNYVYFITLQKYDHICPAPLIKIAGSASGEELEAWSRRRIRLWTHEKRGVARS